MRSLKVMGIVLLVIALMSISTIAMANEKTYFRFNDLELPLSQKLGEPTTVYATVENVGSYEGTVYVNFFVDRYLADTKEIKLKRGEKEDLSFTVNLKLGNHKVSIGDLTSKEVIIGKESPAIFQDLSGHGNDGIVKGDPLLVGGKFGNALLFDGVDDYLEIPDNVSLHSDTCFTVEAWAYIRAFPSPDHAPVVWRGNNLVSSWDYQYRIAIREDGSITWGCGGPTGEGKPDKPEYWFNGGSIADKLNQWTHFVLIADESILSGYINGKQVSSRTDAIPPYNVKEYKTYLGWANRNGVDAWTTTIIDEVCVYNKALTQDEIQERYKENKLIREGMVLWLSFDEESVQ